MRRALLAAVLALLLAPSGALAHAQLLSTSPERGAQLSEAPASASLRFDEPVEAAFGSVRVFGPRGERVDKGDLTRPAGDRTVAAGLRATGDGVYTLTYRVTSADGHPVTGGFTFTVGESGPAVGRTVGELLEDQGTDEATSWIYGVARGAGYLAIALAVGSLAFVMLVWRGLSVSERSRIAFDRAHGRLLLCACAIGLVAGVLALIGQAASAAGTSLFAAADPGSIAEIAGTRTGTALVCRLAAWLSLLAAVVLIGHRSLSRTRPGAAVLGAVAVCVLIATPALGGHAGVTAPVWLSTGASVIHVVAMSVWVGGIAALLFAVAAATRAAPTGQRAEMLLKVVSRFSPIALMAVAAVVASGIVQAVIQLDAFSDLLATAFGRAILVKSGLVALLVGVGAVLRYSSIPRLRAVVRRRGRPGDAGRSIRTALRAEVVLLMAVIAVTAALVSYSPSPAANGVLSDSFELGNAEVELTVSPLRRGVQEIHLYLFDPVSGQPLRRTGEMAVSLTLPSEQVGPLAVPLRAGGPGHLIATPTTSLAGGWRVTVSRRQSRFDSFAHTTAMRVR